MFIVPNEFQTKHSVEEKITSAPANFAHYSITVSILISY
jgi:hypothetical protein